jgi:hypothetical protein
MNVQAQTDYGPLTLLIGAWSGDKGLDVAPEPNGSEENPYFESIIFSEAGGVTNAESQVLAALHYRQIVRRKSDGNVFHDQAGYWIWDQQRELVMNSFSIPRGVCVLAGGPYSELDSPTGVKLIVSSVDGDAKWSLVQSPFMHENAQTSAFQQQLSITADKLVYSQTTMLNIYGRAFEHTDENELERN